MGISRFAGLAMAAAFTCMITTPAMAVSSQAECISQDGTVMDLQDVKHCLVPIIPEEFQGVEYAGELKGVNECKGDVRKTSIGDFCLIALEKKPAKTQASSSSSPQINKAISSSASSMADTAEKSEKAKKASSK